MQKDRRILKVQIWGFRILIVAAMALLCGLAGSSIPALAIAVAWGPNGLFLFAFQRGVLQLPRVLEQVKPLEPVLYRWLGIGLVKRIVATSQWPMINGFDPPPKPKNREELLVRTELTAKGAEICHAATFILAASIALYCLAIGRTSEAFWILVFNLLLNGYPVMLQRTHRWRIQQLRAQA